MLLSISRTSTGNNFYFCSICNITFILLKVKVWNIISYFFHIRACLKNHSRNLHAPLCGIFCPNSVAVARYGALIRTKSPTNCDAHLAESLFQTRSRRLFLCRMGYCCVGHPGRKVSSNSSFPVPLSVKTPVS